MIEGAFSSIVGGSDTAIDDDFSFFWLDCRSDCLVGMAGVAAGVPRFLRGGIRGIGLNRWGFSVVLS